MPGGSCLHALQQLQPFCVPALVGVIGWMCACVLDHVGGLLVPRGMLSWYAGNFQSSSPSSLWHSPKCTELLMRRCAPAERPNNGANNAGLSAGSTFVVIVVTFSWCGVWVWCKSPGRTGGPGGRLIFCQVAAMVGSA